MLDTYFIHFVAVAWVLLGCGSGAAILLRWRLWRCRVIARRSLRIRIGAEGKLKCPLSRGSAAAGLAAATPFGEGGPLRGAER